ncbi:regulatory GntR family protein [Hasllibacter halocynthiae]|uniref:Regulatory GntR family protein n=1 Tax=Hasllibacter halocynthiae TaxID=595589 RepID=A0A2T0WZD1_9RHOB|nr:GntR family transcriptional regulator [Hasllibacter halocynthiae]PRY92005.1 regulatory GntR family protein [Hasllibacter halocynthiae]
MSGGIRIDPAGVPRRPVPGAPRPEAPAGIAAPRLPGGLAGRVERSLRAAMHRLELRPGQHLGIGPIADGHGVSAVPVREALIALVAHRLVEHAPAHGFRVRPVPFAEAEDHHILIRLALGETILRFKDRPPPLPGRAAGLPIADRLVLLGRETLGLAVGAALVRSVDVMRPVWNAGAGADVPGKGRGGAGLPLVVEFARLGRRLPEIHAAYERLIV